MPVTAEDLMEWASGHRSETMTEDEPLPGEVEDQDPDALPEEEMAPRNALWAGEWDGDPNSITPEMAEELFEFLTENEPAIASAVMGLGAALVGDAQAPETGGVDEPPGELPPLEDELPEDDEPLFGDDELEEDDEEGAEELEDGEEEPEGLEDLEDDEELEDELEGDEDEEETGELFDEETPAGEDEPFGDDTPPPLEELPPDEAPPLEGDPNSSPVESAKASMMEAVQNLNPEYPELTPAQRARAADFIAEEIRAAGHPAKDSPEWKQAVAIGLAKARKE